MKAIIFAAGLGTRLQPLTNNKPKALVLLNGKPLLYHAIEQLKTAGISEIIVNVHHFADLIIDYLTKTDFGIPISISDERTEVLETGGGILKAKWFLNGAEPFIAFNVDIISSANLKAAIAFHQQSNALVTLIVRQRKTSRYFMFDSKMQLCGWKNFATGESKISNTGFEHASPWAFSGIQIISPEIFHHITETGKFSVVPLYLRLATNQKLMAYADTSEFWLDLGKPGQIELAEKWLEK